MTLYKKPFACLALGASLLLAPGAQALTPSLRVGQLTLHPCEGTAGALGGYCGRLSRSLDPTGRVSGRLSIYFEFYAHTRSGPAAGLLVATEGGPGYPATESRKEYLALFEPLRGSRDVLIMDNRGTGRSGALDCPELQAAERWTPELVAACGVSLGDRARLYGTEAAADDLAELLERLGAGKIDLYGDSYGTYFEQVFAARHPQALRSMVLDGAYPLDGPDYAWYPNYAPAVRAKFDIACRRSPVCATLPGESMDRIGALLARLRRDPQAVSAVDADGKGRRFTADAAHLASLMFGSDPALATVRELDAAARADLAGDRTPLLRLMAETVAGIDSADARDAAHDIRQWSAGLEVAVMCGDPPQIFDMRLAPAERIVARDRALAERRRSSPETYAPFTLDEYRGMPLDYSFIDQCVLWPLTRPEPHTQPSAPGSGRGGSGAVYLDLPALVISGELDNMTSPRDGQATAAAFSHGRQVLIVNGFHVNALPHARSACAAHLAQRFFETLETGDTQCAKEVPPVRLVARFARRADELEPAEPRPGHPTSPSALRLAAAAAATVADVLIRADESSSGRGVGLRGGTFRVSGAGAERRIELEGVRWTDDVAVSGTIDATPAPDRSVHAHVSIDGPAGVAGRLEIGWPDGARNARAALEGVIGTERIVAQMPAP